MTNIFGPNVLFFCFILFILIYWQMAKICLRQHVKTYSTTTTEATRGFLDCIINGGTIIGKLQSFLFLILLKCNNYQCNFIKISFYAFSTYLRLCPETKSRLLLHQVTMLHHVLFPRFVYQKDHYCNSLVKRLQYTI